jgi:uncharacterized protein (DUF2249 family)
MIEIDVRSDDADALHQLEESLDRLGVGEALRLVVGHDPESEHRQLAERRADQFEWRTVQSGPDAWEVEVTSRARVVDARPTLAAGAEPFGEIMRAAGQVTPGEVLVVLAPFDPVPLQGVLGAQGFSYDSEPIGDGDFRVVFRLG